MSDDVDDNRIETAYMRKRISSSSIFTKKPLHLHKKSNIYAKKRESCAKNANLRQKSDIGANIVKLAPKKQNLC